MIIRNHMHSNVVQDHANTLVSTIGTPCLWNKIMGSWKIRRGSQKTEQCVAVVPTWASCQIRRFAGCACAGNAGNVFLTSKFRGNRITARVSRTYLMHVGNTNPAVAGKRSRRMRNPQFYLSGKRPTPQGKQLSPFRGISDSSFMENSMNGFPRHIHHRSEIIRGMM